MVIDHRLELYKLYYTIIIGRALFYTRLAKSNKKTIYISRLAFIDLEREKEREGG